MFQAPPEIMAWFKNLTDKQLVEFFYQAVQGRRISGDGEDYHQEHLVLANASRYTDGIDSETKSENSDLWSLELLAIFDRQHNQSKWDDAPICQAGNCKCNTHNILSYDKYSTYPICGSPVSGT